MKTLPRILPQASLLLLASVSIAASACSAADFESEDAASASVVSPNADVTSDGDVMMKRASLGAQVYTLVATSINAEWNRECGPVPPDYHPSTPTDVPDTCLFRVVPHASRLVTFELDGREVVMRETQTGTGELARFRLKGESAGTIRFAFNPAVVHAKIGIASAEDPPLLPALTVISPTVKTWQDGEYIVTQQDGFVRLPSGEVPLRVKYGLARHRSNRAFEPRHQAAGQPRHFYTINSPDRPIARFDFSGGRVYTIRNVNVPDAERAVAEAGLQGALDYWNRVFRAASGEQRTFFAVEQNDGSEVWPHDPGHNVIMWMRNPLNSSSNGVFQTDPLTGETLFSNAYISAAFFDAGRGAGRSLYEHVSRQPADGAVVERFMADYILETVAHEIGHTLGLHHDFEASNLAEGLSPADLTKVGLAYFRRGEVPAELCASVMEYLPIPLAGMLGRRMRTAMLPHDLVAISRGYFGREPDLARFFPPSIVEIMQRLPYCNNDDMSAPTCRQFDHPLCTTVPDCYAR